MGGEWRGCGDDHLSGAVEACGGVAGADFDGDPGEDDADNEHGEEDFDEREGSSAPGEGGRLGMRAAIMRTS